MINLKNLTLEVYSAPWCPDCRRLEQWMLDQGIDHTVVDIETTSGAAEKLEKETGKRAIPFLLVNGKYWLRGYHKELPQRFSSALFLEELEKITGAS